MSYTKKKPVIDPAAMLSAYVPPHCHEAECGLLSLMLTLPELCELYSQEMQVSDFYRLHHQSIFTLLCDMNKAEIAIDLFTFLGEAQKSGGLDECGGVNYVRELYILTPHCKMAEAYARQIKDAAASRVLSEGAVSLLEATQNGGSRETLTEKAEALIQNAPTDRDPATKDAKSILRELDREIESRAENPDVMLGIPTGFRDIDTQINGLQAPDMIVIGARPSVGKSALVTCIAANVALSGTPVLLMSLEMSQRQVMTRIICADARLSSHRVKAGRMTADEWDRYNHSSQKYYGVPLHVNDQSGVKPDALRAEIRKVIKRHGHIGLVIVDYLQLMKADEKLSGRYEIITALSIELKSICREFSVPMIILSQLSRDVEKRDNKRPMLGDVRESGQIEQDADIVAFLYRENMYQSDRATNKELPDPTALDLVETELIFRKHRNGPVGTVMLDFVEQFALFLDTVDDGF